MLSFTKLLLRHLWTPLEQLLVSNFNPLMLLLHSAIPLFSYSIWFLHIVHSFIFLQSSTDNALPPLYFLVNCGNLEYLK